MALKWLIHTAKKYIPAIVVITLINAVYALISVLLALFCKGIIDSAVAGKREEMLTYAAGMAAIIMLAFIIRIVSNNLTEMVRVKLEILFRNKITSQLAHKEYSQIGKIHSGELMNRLFNDVQIVSNSFATIVPGVVTLSVKTICAVSVLFVLSPKFTIVLFVGGIIFVAVTAILRGRMKSLHKNVQEKAGVVRSFLQEMLESILIVKVFSAEDVMESRSEELHSDYYKAHIRKRRISIFAGAGIGIAFEAAYMAALVTGASGLIAGTMTYGTLTAVLQLVNQIQQPLMNLSGYLPRYYSMIASTERIMEIEELADESETLNDEKYIDVYENQLPKSIIFKDVDFSYDRNVILSNVNAEVNAGDFVAITGISGGGKSTMFLLMMAAYKPMAGSVDILFDNGEKMNACKETRKFFSYVPQGNYLFSGTLRDNITIWSKEVDEAKLKLSLEIACADKFIEGLPEGLETLVGERGFGLSEGQVQRIAIARAIYSGAPVLLLDESTSALDEETELKVLRNISGLEGKTCFIVTHRKAAIQFCNKHFILKDSEITNL